MNDGKIKKSPPQTSTFKTFDLWLSAFLLAKGKKMEEATWQSGKLAFTFVDDGTTSTLIADFVNGDAIVNVRKFADAHKNLKTLLYFKKEGGRNE